MKERFENWQKAIKLKGHERITLMVIPHGEAHILSLQVSKFTIFFGSLIILLIMGASILSTELQESMQSEVTELHDTNQTFYYKREQYYEKLENLASYHNELKNKIITLFEQTKLSNSENIFDTTEIALSQRALEEMDMEAAEFTSQMQQLVALKARSDITTDVNYPLLDEFEQLPDHKKFAYNSMVVSYRKLRLELHQTVQLLNILGSFLNEREDVQNNLPYYWPIAGGHFTSFYGPRFSPFGRNSEFHLGVDLADTIGTPIYASAEGRVIRAGFSGGYGRRVMIQHRFGYATVYAHMNSILVKDGQYVNKGDLIGRVGSTGRATGPHLHFEVRINGKNVDPLPFLTSR